MDVVPRVKGVRAGPSHIASVPRISLLPRIGVFDRGAARVAILWRLGPIINAFSHVPVASRSVLQESR
jgi:hypothetical protein